MFWGQVGLWAVNYGRRYEIIQFAVYIDVVDGQCPG